MLTCFTFALPIGAMADYSPKFKALYERHSAYELDFKSAPVVHQKITTTRKEAIERLQPMIEELVEKELNSKDRVQDIFCGPKYEHDAKECDSLDDVITSLLKTPGAKSFSPEIVTQMRSKALSADKSKASVFTIKEKEDGLNLIETETSTTLGRDRIFDFTVSNSGHAYSFTNHLADYGKYANAKARIDEKDAEAIGREIIDRYNLIPKEMREELVFTKTRYTHFTGQVADPGDRVVGTSIYFGRKLNGIPFAGPGSFIEIELIKNNDIHSIDVDWTPMVSSKQEKLVINREELTNRIGRIIQDFSESTDKPQIEITDMLCGYFDHGDPLTVLPADRSTEVQLGCMVDYHYIGSEDQPFVIGIPISDEVVEDQLWEESVMVLMAGSIPDSKFDNVHFSHQPSNLKRSGTLSLSTNFTGTEEEDLDPTSGDLNCSVVTPGTTATAATAIIAALLGLFLIRRFTTNHKIKNFLGTFLALIILALPITGAAVGGNADYNTFMFKHYTDGPGGCRDHSSTQWRNWNDWRNEMDDYIDPYVALKDPGNLAYSLAGSGRMFGLNADLVAIDSHGNYECTGSSRNYRGYIFDRDCNVIDSRNIEPLDDEVEIYLINACSVYSRNNKRNWYGFRNMHRHGAVVAAGCWGICSLHGGIANTWKRTGDSIADHNSTIKNAWWRGARVGKRYHPIIIGLGRVGANNCDNRARNVKFSNRNNYYEYQYGHNEPYSTSNNAKELCGYYGSRN